MVSSKGKRRVGYAYKVVVFDGGTLSCVHHHNTARGQIMAGRADVEIKLARTKGMNASQGA